ncbi:PepSY domain-containing protein [Pedobacter sp.]|uniref:PepSY domain-containing protein n=1 Tax=Pedobacter sp. TaxID=1411316 RepID=UPI003D7FE886
MTISFWRYSHLALAISSFLFIALASITGIILAVEPIIQQQNNYRVKNFDQVSVAQATTILKKKYPGLTDISIDLNGSVTIKGTDDAGEQMLACVDPTTGSILGAPYQQSGFFQWVTAFHRSLFLHEAGRVFMGIIAFLLFLISVSGTALIIQRQRGVKRFFTRIVKDNFAQYWHVVLGRLSLLPIIIISLTGAYITVSRFDFFKEQKIVHEVDIDNMKTDPQQQPADFAVFKNTPLSAVQTIQFPFSEFPEDYYTLKLQDKEIVVNQFTGDVLSDIKYNKSTYWTNLNLNLHTGRTNVVWALVLLIASANIIFFIWSGLVITLKRRSGRVKNKYKSDDSQIIILVGSENGSTFLYAKAVYQQLLKQGHKAYIGELNSYTTFPKAEHLIVMTATYGLGDAPANATKFVSLLHKYPQQQALKTSVLGFGSHAYPDFCRFAYEVNQMLQQTDGLHSLIDIHTVNDRSPENLNLWAEAWSQQSGMVVTLAANLAMVPKKLQQLTVISNTAGSNGNTFLLRLGIKGRENVTSGDLLAIYPANDHRERLYSIGMRGKEIQLSVKLLESGLGSSFLYALKAGDSLKGRLVSNPHFHFPTKAPAVVLIANGTGIAPFLGMISQNSNRSAISLYCGFREMSSFAPYADFLKEQQGAGKLQSLKIALSREGDQQYVNDLLAADRVFLAETLKMNGCIMICGSLAMQKDVLALLDSICEAQLEHKLTWYQAQGRILMDCY